MHAKSYKLTNSKNSAMTPGSPFISQAQIFKHLLSKSWKHRQLPQSRPENMDSYTRKKESEVTQSYPTLCKPMDCSLPGSSIHGIFQARILKWVAISFSRRTSQPRDWTWVSRTVGRRHAIWANFSANPWIVLGNLPSWLGKQGHDLLDP